MQSQITIPVGTSVKEAEKALILATVSACQGDKRKAAATLKISTKTLYNKLARIPPEEKAIRCSVCGGG